jgi:hypothetical protein
MKLLNNKTQAKAKQKAKQSILPTDSDRIFIDEDFDDMIIKMLKINNDIPTDINLLDPLDK